MHLLHQNFSEIRTYSFAYFSTIHKGVFQKIAVLYIRIEKL